MPALELTSARVRLREWRADDATKVWALVEDQGNIFGPVGKIASLEDATRWVSNEVADQSAPDRTKYRFALELVGDGTLIGGCRVHIEDVSNKMASIGMALHHPHWGQGYGTEIGILLLQMAFEQLGVHRIEALVEPTNERSLGLVRRAGFTREGLLRERILDDRWIDTEVWSLLEREWRAR
ncbi:MAG: GNAT family N-acetyltransferase [Actinomycetota bacterium]